MLVLGIDPGTATTGYGLVDGRGNTLSLVACGVIETPARQALPFRLDTIYHDLSDLIRRHVPTAMAVEELFFTNNARTAFAVGQARGVCLLAGTQAGLSIYEYTPLEVKQAVTGYGRAGKVQVQQMVRTLLHLDSIPRPDDAADALAVAICHHHSATMRAITQRGADRGSDQAHVP